MTRAWRLVKFVDNGMLTMTKCSKCGGHFVTHPHEIAKHYVCGLCNPPARAGKGKAAGVDPDALSLAPDGLKFLRRTAETDGFSGFLACLLQHSPCAFKRLPRGPFFLPSRRGRGRRDRLKAGSRR